MDESGNLHQQKITKEQTNDTIYEVVFRPLLERPEYQVEPVRSKLLQLKEDMGEEDFDKYISPLLRVTYNGQALWLITGREMHRTMIEGRYLPVIAKAFGVKNIRVFSQT